MEKSLISELSSARGKFCDDRTLEISVSSDISVMKQSVETSSDISTIRSVVINKIENIINALEQKKEQDMLRLEKMEKTFEALSNKMSYIVNETQAISKRSLETEIESYHDNLTQLYNRKAYNKKLKETLADLDRYNATASLLICDIDYFKKINDNFGHHIGDLTLKKFAQLLKEKLRKNDFISRYAGDEFICILPHTQLERTRQAAEKIRSFIDKTSFIFKSKEVPVTISVGISTLRAEDDATTIFERADIALYLAKHSGRNMVKTEDDVKKEGKNFSHYLIETGFENE
jgi:diguanylate cyclase (GGDEF)-like protein